jgi:hypothetical protein
VINYSARGVEAGLESGVLSSDWATGPEKGLDTKDEQFSKELSTILTREADIGPQIVKNHFFERGRFFLLRITFDRDTGKLRRCAHLVAPAMEMSSEWSLVQRGARIVEILRAAISPSRVHIASVGAKI